jgi:hypothetical protein
VSAFALFRNEQVAAGDGGVVLVGFGEVLARWEALADELREVYEQRVE